MINLNEILINLFFPKKCACCNSLVHENRLVCEQCEKQIKAERNVGVFCYNNRELFPSSYFRSFEFDNCIAPFIYSGTIRNGLHGLKFRNKVTAAEFFIKEMSDCIVKNLTEPIDGVVYVPLSKRRKAKRGYDQAALLAKGIAKNLNLPLFENTLQKIWDNTEQHNSEYYRRFGNIFGVYEANREYCTGKRLLLVDDITTTGATFNECAKMLKLSGAKAIYCTAAACVLKNKKVNK